MFRLCRPAALAVMMATSAAAIFPQASASVAQDVDVVGVGSKFSPSLRAVGHDHDQDVAASEDEDNVAASSSQQHRGLGGAMGKYLKRESVYSVDESQLLGGVESSETAAFFELPDGIMIEVVGLTEDDKASLSSGDDITLPAEAEITSSGTKIDLHGNPVGIGRSPDASSHGRKLATLTGDKTVIVVRVRTSCNQVTIKTEAELEDDFFDDAANLATQYKACSHDKLNIIKGADATSTDTSKATNIVNGIVTVDIASCVTAGDDVDVMQNEVTAALNAAFAVTSPSELADHLVYCMPPGAIPYIGYGFYDTWLSIIYGNSWVASLSNQMWLMGINLNFAISNEGGVRYGDASCIMGSSYMEDDTPKRCFNAAKSWQTGWFADKSLAIDTNNDVGTCFSGALYGTDSYASSPADATVLIQLQSITGTHFHIGFNGAQGANVGTQEHANEVLITTQAEGGAQMSDKISHLGAGGSYTIANYDGVVGKDVVISVTSISGTDHAVIEIDCGNAWPSFQPSFQPSKSSQPSSQPSESSQPSSEPSSQPSESSQPSSEPSYQPSASAMPSCSPSSTPTEAPSAGDVNLFYPKWTQEFEGCRNDGDEPDYMALDPTEWLTSSMEACCKKFFDGYMFDSCMGRYPPDHDDCNQMLFYPDWQGANEGCIDDGQEPYYMLSNHHYFLSNTLEECCEKFYGWDIHGCTGTTPVLTNGEYYPEWASRTCQNDDDEVPLFMLNDQRWYFSTTLQKCCEKHFFFDINACMGSSSMTGSNKWYVDYDEGTCVKDCDGGSSCGGIAEKWDQLFEDKEECCKEKMWYSIKGCRTKSV